MWGWPQLRLTEKAYRYTRSSSVSNEPVKLLLDTWPCVVMLPILTVLRTVHTSVACAPGANVIGANATYPAP